MAERRIETNGLRDLLDECLRDVKAGHTLVIVENGEPVGRLTPVAESLEARVRAMVDAGLADWSGNKLKPISPPATARGPHTVADLLIEDRQ